MPLTLASANVLGQHQYLRGLAHHQRIDDSRVLARRYGLVSAWEFNNSGSLGADVYGANNLTNNNSVTQAVGPNGANAAAFASASSQFLSIASNTSVQAGNVDFWGSQWVYLTNKVATQEFVSKYGTGATATREYVSFYFSVTDRFRVNVIGSTETGLEASTFGSPSATTWYHLFWYYDSVKQTQNIAVNGGAFDSLAHTTGVNATAAPFQIGNASSGTAYCNGRIAHVAFGKSPPLGIAALASEINTYLYNNGNGRSYPWY